MSAWPSDVRGDWLDALHWPEYGYRVAIDSASSAVFFLPRPSRGFLKDGNKNRLRSQDIHKIVDVFRRKIELPRYSRMVPVADIASPDSGYNLNIPRNIDSSEPEDLHDLDALEAGGFTRKGSCFSAEWREAMFTR